VYATVNSHAGFACLEIRQGRNILVYLTDINQSHSSLSKPCFCMIYFCLLCERLQCKKSKIVVKQRLNARNVDFACVYWWHMRLQRSIVCILGSRTCNFFYPSKKPKRGIGLRCCPFSFTMPELKQNCIRHAKPAYELPKLIYFLYSVRPNPIIAGRGNISPILIESADLGRF